MLVTVQLTEPLPETKSSTNHLTFSKLKRIGKHDLGFYSNYFVVLYSNLYLPHSFHGKIGHVNSIELQTLQTSPKTLQLPSSFNICNPASGQESTSPFHVFVWKNPGPEWTNAWSNPQQNPQKIEDKNQSQYLLEKILRYHLWPMYMIPHVEIRTKTDLPIDT